MLAVLVILSAVLNIPRGVLGKSDMTLNPCHYTPNGKVECPK